VIGLAFTRLTREVRQRLLVEQMQTVSRPDP